jgi:periplasmic divalent cation tolerance protein
MNVHHLSLYVTCADVQEAEIIARTLLQERLIACANIQPQTRSLYHWEGALQEDEETTLIMKTGKGHIETVIERIRALHSYDCPCIVAHPIVYGNEDYLNWIDAQLG